MISIFVIFVILLNNWFQLKVKAPQDVTELTDMVNSLLGVDVFTNKLLHALGYRQFVIVFI